MELKKVFKKKPPRKQEQSVIDYMNEPKITYVSVEMTATEWYSVYQHSHELGLSADGIAPKPEEPAKEDAKKADEILLESEDASDKGKEQKK